MKNVNFENNVIDIEQYDCPCEICSRVGECTEDDLDMGMDNAYECFNRGWK